MADPPEYANLFAQWESQGQMSKAQVLQRLDEKMDFYFYYDPNHQYIIENFDTLTKENSRCWDESAFIAFLTSRFPPSSTSISEAGPILYSSAIYLAGFPFVENPEPLLTLEALKRAVLLCSACNDCWIAEATSYSGSTGEVVRCRGRTETAYIRLIFQSLASPEARLSSNTDLQMAETVSISAIPNNDDDGDELFHDVLDVISATLPLEVWEAHPSRDQLRPLAKSIWNTELRLCQYRIDRNRLTTFVKPLIALAFWNGDYEIVDFTGNELDEVANHVVNAFDLGQRAISWPAFYTTIKTMPFLFKGLQRLMSSFLEPPSLSFGSSTTSSPQTGRILTISVMAQLSLALRDNIVFDSLKLLFQLPSCNSDNLKDILQKNDGNFLLLVHGQTKTHEFITFGVSFTPHCEVKEFQEPNPLWIDSCLFEIAPIHDIWVAPNQDYSMTLTDGEILFGSRDAGVAISLAGNLEKATLSHRTTPGGAFNGNRWRGDWECQVDVCDIEVWQMNPLP